jgi:hypothetical protein
MKVDVLQLRPGQLRPSNRDVTNAARKIDGVDDREARRERSGDRMELIDWYIVQHTLKER